MPEESISEIDELLLRGRDLYARRQFDEAEAVHRELLARTTHPSPETRSAWALCLLGIGNAERALQEGKAAALEGPSVAAVRFNLGHILQAAGQFDLGLEENRIAADLEPENVDYIAGLGLAG